MKARNQRTQNQPYAPRTHWQGKTSHNLRESWSTAPAATLPVAHPKSPPRETTREESPIQPSDQAVDIEALEQRFFAEGMSEDALLAASEREQEREHEREVFRPGRGAKLLLGGAMCTALAVVITGTLVRQVNGSEPAPVPLAITTMVTPPSPPVAQVAAPTPAPPPSVVDVTGLRGPGSAPAQAAAVAAAVPQEPADPQEACAQVLKRGRYREISQHCAAAFAAAPSADLAGRIAEMALERGRHGDAAVWARRAIHENPRFALAFVYLGGAEQELGHRDAARAAYSRYLDLAPQGQHADDVRALLDATE